MKLALIDFGDGFTDSAVIQDLLLIDAARDQGGGAQAVDLARNAATVFEDAFEGIITERRTGGKPGDAQVVLDIIQGLFEIQGGELVRIGQALAEGLMDGQVQSLAEDEGSNKQ